MNVGVNTAAQQLAGQVRDLAWKGCYWGADGAIRKAERLHCLSLGQRGQSAWSALSSTYYSAAGNALARARANLLMAPYWLVQAYRYLEKAHRASDRAAASGYEPMSADELDVRQSILRKCGDLDGALACIDHALGKPGLRADTNLLLLVGRAEILEAQGFVTLPVHAEHAHAVARLPETGHRDPFDRLLVAQARVEMLPIISADAQLDQYAIARLW